MDGRLARNYIMEGKYRLANMAMKIKMTETYWQDNTRIVYNKDCRDMSELANNSIQCIVTSSPYWGLRKYSGLPDLIWGGDKKCEHKNWGKTIERERIGWEATPEGQKQFKSAESEAYKSQSCFCSFCGAWKGQLGLEPTPELYLDHLVEICCEIRRVMRKDGVFFLNIGDSYMSGGGPTRHYGWADPKNLARGIQDYPEPTAYPHKLIKPKDLCLIPFRLAIRL